MWPKASGKGRHSYQARYPEGLEVTSQELGKSQIFPWARLIFYYTGTSPSHYDIQDQGGSSSLFSVDLQSFVLCPAYRQNLSRIRSCSASGTKPDLTRERLRFQLSNRAALLLHRSPCLHPRQVPGFLCCLHQLSSYLGSFSDWGYGCSAYALLLDSSPSLRALVGVWILPPTSWPRLYVSSPEISWLLRLFSAVTPWLDSGTGYWTEPQHLQQGLPCLCGLVRSCSFWPSLSKLAIPYPKLCYYALEVFSAKPGPPLCKQGKFKGP